MGYKLKVICYTPKGKAEACMKGWALQKTLGGNKAPIDAKIVNDSEFFYIFDYEKEAQRDNVVFKKIPVTEFLIRKTYKGLMNRFRKASDFNEMQQFLDRPCLIWYELMEE